MQDKIDIICKFRPSKKTMVKRHVSLSCEFQKVTRVKVAEALKAQDKRFFEYVCNRFQWEAIL